MIISFSNKLPIVQQFWPEDAIRICSAKFILQIEGSNVLLSCRNLITKSLPSPFFRFLIVSLSYCKLNPLEGILMDLPPLAGTVFLGLGCQSGRTLSVLRAIMLTNWRISTLSLLKSTTQLSSGALVLSNGTICRLKNRSNFPWNS